MKTATQDFTVEDADRLLGLADQFLENWAETAVQNERPDPDYEERQAEWEAIRPLLAAAPHMLQALICQDMADADPAAARRKGYYDTARAMRKVALAKAGI